MDAEIEDHYNNNFLEWRVYDTNAGMAYRFTDISLKPMHIATFWKVIGYQLSALAKYRL